MTDTNVALRPSSELQQFDPVRATKEIATAEALESWARRAKDHEALYRAIEHKVRNQRDFVLWWDAQEKDMGGRPSKTCFRSETGFNRLADYGLNHLTVHRWRSRFVDPEAPSDESLVEKYLAPIQAKCLQIVEAHQSASFSSESVEWYTPAVYIEAVRRLYGGVIDLDPASSEQANATVQAEIFYTREDDGLKQRWDGRVFLNPPYGLTGDKQSLAGAFCQKAINEWSCGHAEAVVILVNSVHSQEWQRPLYGHTVCFVDHRIKFVSGDGETNKSPTFQNIFVYLGKDIDGFVKEFSPFGYVMRMVHTA